MATYGLVKASPLVLKDINETRVRAGKKRLGQAWYLYYMSKAPQFIDLFATKAAAQAKARKHALSRLGSHEVKFVKAR